MTLITQANNAQMKPEEPSPVWKEFREAAKYFGKGVVLSAGAAVCGLAMIATPFLAPANEAGSALLLGGASGALSLWCSAMSAASFIDGVDAVERGVSAIRKSRLCAAYNLGSAA